MADVVADAVDKVVAQSEKEREEAELAKELEELEAKATGEGLVITSAPRQEFLALRNEFLRWDDQRATNKVQTDIAKEAGDTEDAKRLLAAKPGIMKHLRIILSRMVDAVASAEDVQNEVAFWVTPDAMSANMRDLLASHLKRTHDVDVHLVVERAVAIEDARREQAKLLAKTL